MSNQIIPVNRYQVVMKTADLLFKGGMLPAAERDELVTFIMSRTNRRKGFVFYPTFDERTAGIRLISGEKPRTLLLADNAVELETLRLLVLLQPDAYATQQLFAEADLRLHKKCFSTVCMVGECAAASIAYLRYLTARSSEIYAAQIEHGLASLANDRDGRGKWRHFPTRFTQRWLLELPPSLSAPELAYIRS